MHEKSFAERLRNNYALIMLHAETSSAFKKPHCKQDILLWTKGLL
jgi:hypothetical protein